MVKQSEEASKMNYYQGWLKYWEEELSKTDDEDKIKIIKKKIEKLHKKIDAVEQGLPTPTRHVSKEEKITYGKVELPDRPEKINVDSKLLEKEILGKVVKLTKTEFNDYSKISKLINSIFELAQLNKISLGGETFKYMGTELAGKTVVIVIKMPDWYLHPPERMENKAEFISARKILDIIYLLLSNIVESNRKYTFSLFTSSPTESEYEREQREEKSREE